jgi:hypothetical protein
MRNAAMITPDRYLFLCALQNAAPAFFAGLKGSIDSGTSVEDWAEHVGVVDDWFMEVLRATVKRWREHPEHRGSQLAEGYEWFAYPGDDPVEPFAVTFTDPYPQFSGIAADPNTNTAQSIAERSSIRKTWCIETPYAFGRRMKEQFNTALAEYKQYLRRITPLNDIRGQRREHTQWTALLAFGKMADGSPITIAEIAKRWPTLKRHKDRYATVHKAIHRFASDIGLTFPKMKLDKL